MTHTGKRLGAITALLMAWLISVPATAEVTTTVDRRQVALGDSLRLVITSTEGEEISDIDFRPLEKHFDILQRSTSSQMNIVNGSRSHTKQLIVDIAPTIEGEVEIPGLDVDGVLTRPITITVAATAEHTGGDEAVIFEAEVDQSEVYVQAQLILTLRLKQAVQLDARSISELELDNAFVKPLEQKSFQRNIDGRPWLVHEVRYAIFPEQSGTLDIPAQVFTGREATPRRSLFDLGNSGRRIRRASQPLSVEVLPRPAHFPSPAWLPAREVRIEEQWSTAPEQLAVGESATRTIRISGTGLQGAQLPPTLFQPVAGLKFYPDQPDIDETEVADGLLGTRRDSAALVPTQPGTLTLPEIRIPWWDTQSRTVRYATLPERNIAIAAAASSVQAPPVNQPPLTEPAAVTPAAPPGDNLLWQILTIVSTAGWILTLLYLLLTKRQQRSSNTPAKQDSDALPEQKLFKQLQNACNDDSPVQVRQLIIQWSRTLSGDARVASLEDASRFLDHAQLQSELERLDRALYGDNANAWRAEELPERLTQARTAYLQRKRQEATDLTLYPREQQAA